MDLEEQMYENISFLEKNLNTLPMDQQYQLLKSIITSSPGYVKWRIKSFLAMEDSPDLMTLLPTEIQLKILFLVDGCSLLSACQVSKQWSIMINSFSILWKRMCEYLGVNLTDTPACLTWKKLYISSRHQLHLLKKGKAFDGKLIDLQNSKSIIKAMDYQNGGYLCTVSDDDFLIIWNLPLNMPMLSIPLERGVSCVKFKLKSQLVCGHFSGYLTSWDISDMWIKKCIAITSREAFYGYGEELGAFSYMLAKFRMHSGVVLCCDFSEEIQILISGGTDGAVKFWCLQTATLLHNFSRNNWVLQLFLCEHSSLNNHSILCMFADSVFKLSWEYSKNEKSSFESIEMYEDSDASFIKFRAEKHASFDIGNGHVSPGVDRSSKYIGFVKQDSGCASVLILIETDKPETYHSIHINYKVRKLLALGDRYALLAISGEKVFTSSIIVIDIITGQNICSFSIPYSKMTTADGAQIIVCERRWLNGLTGWRCECLAKDGAKSCCPQIAPNMEHPDAAISKGGKLLIHPYGSCILAAGVQIEPEKLFTLWWSSGQDDVKTKMD